jgi:hypothetical protein
MPRVVPSQVVTLIDKLFRFAVTQKDSQQDRVRIDHIYANELAAIVYMADQIPPELIVLAGDHYTAYASSLTAMRTAVTIWQLRGGVEPLENLKGFGYLNPVTLLRRALEQCPDESPAPSTVELAFISEQEFRENLRTDISAANQALSNGEWKAATVLAGAAIEALLLWALQKHSSEEINGTRKTLVSSKQLSSKFSTKLEDWTLDPLIKVAEQLGVIKTETTTLARLTKDFRNLIHPGRAIRLAQTCDRGTALSALAALEHVVRDIGP